MSSCARRADHGIMTSSRKSTNCPTFVDTSRVDASHMTSLQSADRSRRMPSCATRSSCAVLHNRRRASLCAFMRHAAIVALGHRHARWKGSRGASLQSGQCSRLIMNRLSPSWSSSPLLSRGLPSPFRESTSIWSSLAPSRMCPITASVCAAMVESESNDP